MFADFDMLKWKQLKLVSTLPEYVCALFHVNNQVCKKVKVLVFTEDPHMICEACVAVGIYREKFLC